MKNTMKFIAGTAACLLLAGTMSACKKEKKTTSDSTGNTADLTVEIEHKWGTGSANFALNMNLIHPVTHDTLDFTMFRYYVSNIQLQKADGSWWIHPESYFLVDLSDPETCELHLDNVPLDTYTGMKYTLGIDSTRNVSGSQTGALSMANNMFWSWNSGYIMLKAEGISPNSTTGSFAFHLGGFTGANNVVTVNSTDFDGATLTTTANHESEIHLMANPALLWETAGSVSGTNAIHMPGTEAHTMASGFFGGIVFEHLHP